jgi:hypothetical protein
MWQINSNQIFCIHQILEKKWEYNGKVHQLFTDSEKAHDSVRWEVLYNILYEYGISMKLIMLIKMCLVKSIVKYAKVKLYLMYEEE